MIDPATSLIAPTYLGRDAPGTLSADEASLALLEMLETPQAVVSYLHEYALANEPEQVLRLIRSQFDQLRIWDIAVRAALEPVSQEILVRCFHGDVIEIRSASGKVLAVGNSWHATTLDFMVRMWAYAVEYNVASMEMSLKRELQEDDPQANDLSASLRSVIDSWGCSFGRSVEDICSVTYVEHVLKSPYIESSLPVLQLSAGLVGERAVMRDLFASPNGNQRLVADIASIVPLTEATTEGQRKSAPGRVEVEGPHRERYEILICGKVVDVNPQEWIAATLLWGGNSVTLERFGQAVYYERSTSINTIRSLMHRLKKKIRAAGRRCNSSTRNQQVSLRILPSR